MRPASVARQAVVLALSVLWLGGGAEALNRFEGGWRLDRLTLVRRDEAAAAAADSAYEVAKQQAAERALLADVTYSSAVDPNWFFLPPAPLGEPASLRLEERTKANPHGFGQENYVWNDALFGPNPDPHLLELLPELKERQIFAFHSYDGSAFPRYRLYPANDFRPTPWITNHYGWLSVEVQTSKPPRTIRIGIIGDSTSHNFYGRQLQTFLNAWAAAVHLGLSFQVLNGARQGLEQQDEEAVLKYELAPMGLDYVYAYFAPAFAVSGQIRTFVTLPHGVEFGHPPPSKLGWSARLARLVMPLVPYSALARSLQLHWAGTAPGRMLAEPSKPAVKLQLPPGTRDSPVNLQEAEKNPYFGLLVNDLDAFQRTAGRIGAKLVVSDERLCVWQGMRLNSTTDQLLYNSVNGALYWPLRYAQIRRLLNAHNGTINAWAEAHHVPVVDIDGHFPRDPALCSDTFHDEVLGMRLRAWIIFQRLIPIIRKDVSAGAVPRANADPAGRNPAFAAPIEYLDRETLLQGMRTEADKEKQQK
ncbi:MAG TPA: hypothetical protein VMB73_15265 [Acetobacteraceae bacterium]|nr:hypothetical protein [Acetobacteraceae bacterium]